MLIDAYIFYGWLIEKGTDIDEYIYSNEESFEEYLVYQKDSGDEYYFVGNIIQSARYFEPEQLDINNIKLEIDAYKNTHFYFYELMKNKMNEDAKLYLIVSY